MRKRKTGVSKKQRKNNENNDGTTKYGDIQAIIWMYNKLGYKYITAGVLVYMVVH